MKKLLLVPLLCAMLQTVTAQTNQADVVYLKNGSYLKGTIVMLEPEKYLTLVLATGDTLPVQMSDVDSVRKESGEGLQRKGYEGKVKAWGYTFIAEVGFAYGWLLGIQPYTDPAETQYAVMLSVFNGMTLSPYIQLGISTGFAAWRDRIFLPVNLDLRACILKKPVTPFFYSDVGYAYGWSNGQSGKNTGGATAGLGTGMKFGIGKKMVMEASLGYLFQQTRYHHYENYVQTTSVMDAHMICFKAGFVF